MTLFILSIVDKVLIKASFDVDDFSLMLFDLSRDVFPYMRTLSTVK